MGEHPHDIAEEHRLPEPISCVQRNRATLLAAIAFILTTFVSTALLKAREWPETLELAIALLPALPLVAMFAAVIRCVRTLDELEQRIQLEALAVAVVFSALVCFVVGQLQSVDAVGEVRLTSVWVLLSLAYLGAVLLVRRRYRA